MTPRGRHRPGRRSWQARRRPGHTFRPERANHQKSQTRTSSNGHTTAIPQFPPDRRRDDPKLNSEAVVDELEAAPEAPELDFGIWLEDRACFGVQVKGGR